MHEMEVLVNLLLKDTAFVGDKYHLTTMAVLPDIASKTQQKNNSNLENKYCNGEFVYH